MIFPNESDPLTLFRAWYEDAKACNAIKEPTAMTLATIGLDGTPSARVVLLKGYDEHGFVFYTNLQSPKARQLVENPKAALCFYWMPLDRQVRIRGTCTLVSDEEADQYFATRPRQNQVGAWASRQSQALAGRHDLEERVLKYDIKFGLGKIPRPNFWSGFVLAPNAIEFWLKKPFRLHDRLLYTRVADGWESQRIYP